MVYSGPIDLDQLIDPQPLWERGQCPYSFLAFPVVALNEFGVPKDIQAQQYIAAVQAEGVPVGIWLTTPVEGTAYAVVSPSDIQSLHNTVKAMVESKRFPEDFAKELSDRLFRENMSSDDQRSPGKSSIRWSVGAIVYFLLAFVVSAFLVGVIQEVLRPELPTHLEDSSTFLMAYGFVGLLASAGIAWVSVKQKYGSPVER